MARRLRCEARNKSYTQRQTEKASRTYELHNRSIERMEARMTTRLFLPTSRRRSQQHGIGVQIPRDVPPRADPIPAARRVVRAACDEVHFGHDVYPRDLEVDHRGHRGEHAAVGLWWVSTVCALGRVWRWTWTDLKNLFLSSMNWDSIRYVPQTRKPIRLRLRTRTGRNGW